MAKTVDRHKPARRYATATLWTGLIATALLLGVLVELACLTILYAVDSSDEANREAFAQTHLLTKPFVSAPRNPAPGKRFLGTLGSIDARWAKAEVADDLLGWRLAPNVAFFYAPVPPSRYLFSTDEYGFVAGVDDPPVELPKPTNTYRVIIFGGSTVWGTGAPRPSQNIVGMLRKEARERGLVGPNAERVEFINAGVLGYNSAQEYLYLVSDLLRFKPDLIVAYDGVNDSEYDLSDSPSPFRTKTHREMQRRIERSHTISGSFFLVAQNIKNFFTSGDFKLAAIELPWRILNRAKHDEDIPLVPFDPRAVELYGINRRAFLALAGNQLSVALFLQPLVTVDDRDLAPAEKASWWYPKLDHPLIRNRVPFYEGARRILADLIANTPDNTHRCIADLSHSLKGASEPVYADSMHLLPRGNEIVAAHMLDQFVRCGFLR